MVAVGSYYAGAHIVHLDGSYGGTGAAPDIAKKNIAMPIEYAVGKVHNFLKAEGVRDKITIIASGGVRSAWDLAKTIAMGADGVVIGTVEVVALECIRCGACESGRGLPKRYRDNRSGTVKDVRRRLGNPETKEYFPLMGKTAAVHMLASGTQVHHRANRSS